MMAALFLIFVFIVLSIILQNRKLAIAFLIAGLLLSLLMTYHHATDMLQINW